MQSVDLLLAILHHMLVFSLAGILAAEAALLGRGFSGGDMDRLAAADRFYGLVAMLVIVVAPESI